MTLSVKQQCRRVVALAILGLLAWSLWSCLAKPSDSSTTEQIAGRQPIPDVIGARLGIINYLDEGVAPLYINKSWASGAPARSSTTGTCCVAIPSHWKPGMTMRVEWSTDTRYTSGEKKLLVLDAPVMPYEPFSDGYVWAAVFPGGQVFLQPFGGYPGLPGFLQDLPEPEEATEAEIQQFLERNTSKK